MWLPAENSAVALAAHFEADEKSLHSGLYLRDDLAPGHPKIVGGTDMGGHSRMLP